MEPLGLPDQLFFRETEETFLPHKTPSGGESRTLHTGGEAGSAALQTIKNMNLFDIKPKPKLYEDE